MRFKKQFIKTTTGILLAFFGISVCWAEPEISRVRVAQREGSNLVDIYYDLSGAGEDGATVSVELSGDGGSSYGLPISSLTGKAGSGINNGKNHSIVWDAGADQPDFFSATMRLRLTAQEAGEAPEGFALIPAGNFQMGDSFNEGWTDERPVHTVFVSAFYMAKHETTKALWDEVRAWGVNNGYADLPAGGGKGGNHPVHWVSWYDMVKWCNARSQKEGLTPCYTVAGAVYKTGENASVSCNFAASGYRLPTEAEWEKAARGGLSGKRFPWGDTINHSRANYRADGDRYPYDDSPFTDLRYHPTYDNGSFPYSSPVGSFAPNGYGLYDMAGNMWEWCWDLYRRSYYGSSPASDPRGPGPGGDRVVRGGCWGDDAYYCRAADRSSGDPWLPFNRIGFRTARSSVPR